jgi:antirestriction protein
MTTETTTTPRIYVASLSDYNDGTLHGTWIDATLDSDEIYEAVKEMLAKSPYGNSDFAKQWGMKAEEWAIHDYEGFGSIRLSEWEQFDTISEVAQAIEEHGSAYLAYIEDQGMGYGSVSDFKDRFVGTYDSPEAYAESFYQDTGQLDDDHPLSMYINWEAVARDMDYNGYHFATTDEGVHVFTP